MSSDSSFVFITIVRWRKVILICDLTQVTQNVLPYWFTVKSPNPGVTASMYLNLMGANNHKRDCIAVRRISIPDLYGKATVFSRPTTRRSIQTFCQVNFFVGLFIIKMNTFIYIQQQQQQNITETEIQGFAPTVLLWWVLDAGLMVSSNGNEYTVLQQSQCMLCLASS